MDKKVKYINDGRARIFNERRAPLKLNQNSLQVVAQERLAQNS